MLLPLCAHPWGSSRCRRASGGVSFHPRSSRKNSSRIMQSSAIVRVSSCAASRNGFDPVQTSSCAIRSAANTLALAATNSATAAAAVAKRNCMTLGRHLRRQLICAPEFVLYRFREAQPHPREPEHVFAPLWVVHALRPSRALIRSHAPVLGQIQCRGVRFGIRGGLRQFQAVPSDAPVFLCRAHGECFPFVHEPHASVIA